MPTLLMKQGLNLKINDSFKITDEKDQVAFKVVGKLASWGSDLSVQDAEGKEVAHIKQTGKSVVTGALGFADKFIVSKDGKEWGAIKKTNVPLAPTKTMEAKFNDEVGEILITSGVMALAYEFKRGDTQIAKVGKKVVALLDEYEMEFPEEEDKVAMACILVCIDQIYKEGEVTL